MLLKLEDNMPSTIEYLIEALRGGQYKRPKKTVIDRTPGMVPRRDPGTQDGGMPTGMRGYQLYAQETIAQGGTPISYQEWVASQ